MEYPLVSIVVTTKNEEKNIVNCINSIKFQTYKNIEIVVVDNASVDATQKLAKASGAKVFTKGPERSIQRNFGMIEKSAGIYVMYIDADMILSPDLVNGCVQLMAENKGKAVALHIKEIVLGNNYFSKVRRFERSFYDHTSIDAARFFKRDTLISLGGFDEKMIGPEDWDLDKRIKMYGEVIYVPTTRKATDAEWLHVFGDYIRLRGVNPTKADRVIYHNENDFNIWQYLKKKKYYATSFDSYINKWGKSDKDIKKQFGLGYRFFSVFIERGKILRFFSRPDLVLGLYLLRFLVGISYLSRGKGEVSNPYER